MKKLIEKLFGVMPVIGFNPGDHVVLIYDPKQRVYVIEKLDTDENGIPNISRGPMRQLLPSISYMVRDKKYDTIHYFRADSIMQIRMTPRAKRIAKLKHQIRETEQNAFDHEFKAQQEREKIELLKRELDAWTNEYDN